MPDDCILVRTRRSDGYAFSAAGYAHRIAWEAVHGPIPEGMQIDHLCRVRNCVNVAHLEVVTPQENTLRGTGPSATNAQKTHCPQGHEYEQTDKGRRCLECKRATARARRAKYGRRDRGTWTGPTDLRRRS